MREEDLSTVDDYVAREAARVGFKLSALGCLLFLVTGFLIPRLDFLCSMGERA